MDAQRRQQPQVVSPCQGPGPERTVVQAGRAKARPLARPQQEETMVSLKTIPRLSFPSSVTEWEAVLVQMFGSRLTKRQRQVCARRCQGWSGAEIARDLYLDQRTVRSYDDAMLLKFELKSVREISPYCSARLWEWQHSSR